MSLATSPQTRRASLSPPAPPERGGARVYPRKCPVVGLLEVAFTAVSLVRRHLKKAHNRELPIHLDTYAVNTRSSPANAALSTRERSTARAD